MTKYHITDDGPKPCSAQPGKCKYSENGIDPEHYTNIQQAQNAYEEKMGHKTFTVKSSKKTYAPPKPDLEPVTLDEIKSIIERFDKEKV